GKSDAVGNIGVSYLRLSKAPAKETVVTVALNTGDKSISLLEGSRLVFDDQNWNKPAVVLFQLDPKLKTMSSAAYEIRSGNVPLSWVITFCVVVLLFLFFGIYHAFMLPHPARDKAGSANTVLAFLSEFFKTFGAYFSKNRIGVLLLFLLFY